jgi:hypothetical protein
LDGIRNGFDPRDSVVLTITGQDPYRFMMYYLPEFLVLRLDPSVQSVLPARNQRQATWRQVADCLFENSQVHHVVWVLRTRSEPETIPAGATLVADTPDGPFSVWTLEPRPDTPEYLGFRIGGPCST